MFKLTRNGREVPLERFADELKADIQRAAREGIEERVRAAVASLRCPDHGQAASAVRVEYDGGGEVSIAATPCREAMRAEVDRSIRASFEKREEDDGVLGDEDAE